MYTQVSCYAMWVYTRLQGEQENAKWIEGEVGKAAFVIALNLSCHTHTGVFVWVYLFSTGMCVFISALMFPLHVLCVSLSSRNKLPIPLQALRICPFGVCFSLLSFFIIFFPWNLPPLINSAHFLCIAHSPLLFPASLSSCEVCDLCNFILLVAGDISQSRSMNIDELIQSALSKGQTMRSLHPMAPLALPVWYTDMPTSRVLSPRSFSLSGQGLR